MEADSSAPLVDKLDMLALAAHAAARGAGLRPPEGLSAMSLILVVLELFHAEIEQLRRENASLREIRR